MKKRPSSMCALLAVRVAQSLDDGRLTGCLPNPVARHVGDHRAADKSENLRNARLTSTTPLPKDNAGPGNHPSATSVGQALPHPRCANARRASMGCAVDGFTTFDLALFAAG